MQHFFVEPSQITGNQIRIIGDDVNHIRNVLRMKTGEVISVSNGMDGNEYRCEIERITTEEISCKLMFIKEDGIELPGKVYLFQGLPKADKMELIIQKAVELGVYAVIPVATKRSVVKLDEKKAKNKIARWQAISESAAKQSKRAMVPKVMDVMTFHEAIEFASKMDAKVIPYEMAEGMKATKEWLEASVNAEEIAVFIGPEGGFDETEIQKAVEQKICPISLGKRILRTETAGMTALSILMYHLEIKDI